jgi:hypothetical protein
MALIMRYKLFPRTPKWYIGKIEFALHTPMQLSIHQSIPFYQPSFNDPGYCLPEWASFDENDVDMRARPYNDNFYPYPLEAPSIHAQDLNGEPILQSFNHYMSTLPQHQTYKPTHKIPHVHQLKSTPYKIKSKSPPAPPQPVPIPVQVHYQQSMYDGHYYPSHKITPTNSLMRKRIPSYTSYDTQGHAYHLTQAIPGISTPVFGACADKYITYDLLHPPPRTQSPPANFKYRPIPDKEKEDQTQTHKEEEDQE